MLATSHSPHVNATVSASSPESSGFRTHSYEYHHRHRNSKSASPIVKAHSAHVYSYPSTPTPTAITNSATNIVQPQCAPLDARSCPQHQTSLASTSHSIFAVSTGTQTSPSLPEAASSATPRRVLMVDAQTQYSPPAIAHVDKGYTALKTTPATQIASLQIQELIALPEAPTSRNKSFDPVADAAMRAAPTGTTTQLQQQPARAERELTRLPTQPNPSKRNHSVATTESANNTAPSTITHDASPAGPTSTEEKRKSGTPSKKMRPEDAQVKVMPLDYSLCNTRDLVVLIASMLMDLIRYNDTIPLHSNPSHLTRFHSRAPPGISVLDYLQRLTTHATLVPPILLSMVFYIDKLCALYPAFTISSLTVHRFLITAATVASKGLSDSFWTNKTYARVGGVSIKELALLELEFLVRMQWRIVPQNEVLVDYYTSLVGRTEGFHLESLHQGVQAQANHTNKEVG